MKTWTALALVYAVFLFWYGGCGSPLSPEEIAELRIELERAAPSPEVAARVLAFAESDDGREFFMVNLNRYRDEPRYEDGRDTGGATAREVEILYTSKMVPRLLVRACHPWAVVVPILTLGDYEGAPEFDRVTLVRYRSRRDFLDIVITDEWRSDAEHKWAALELAHSFPAQPAITLLGPRTAVLVLLAVLGLGVRRIARARAR